MSLKEIVEQILSCRKDITQEEVMKKIEEKKRLAEGFFTDETAARVVATELGVKILREPFHPEALLIRDLVSGLNDVTVTGRVTAVHPSKAFARPDLTEGKFARLFIADKSGTLKVVLWDDKASLIDAGKIWKGQIVRVSHGYVRGGLDGKLELHSGLRSGIQVSPSNAREEDYPSVAPFMEKIEKITSKSKKASTIGVIKSVYPVSTFKRRDGTAGRVMRLRLEDETGQITAVVWNEKVEQLGEVKIGDSLQITDARVKERIEGQLELHVENATQIKIVSRKILPRIEEKTKVVAEIKEEGGPVTVEGTVVTTPTMKQVVTSRGERVSVASFDLRDNTGKIGVSAWRKLAETAKNLTVGTRIKIKDAYAKRGFADRLELTSRTFTSIEIVSKPENPPKPEET